MVRPNETSGFFKNDGMQVTTLDECNYVQIKLDGNHARHACAYMLVSSSQYIDIIKYKWYLGKNGYPVTYQTVDNTEKFGVGIKLHRMLLGFRAWIENGGESGLVIDHINRNKLDNRLENLRICTAKENSYNTTRRNKDDGKYKGVKKQGKSGKWTAIISKDGNKHEIRDIPTEKEAAQIYDLLAENLFGDYAGKNFN
jgi:hypothetical protein